MYNSPQYRPPQQNVPQQLSPEQLQKLISIANTMVNEGATVENNPEYAKIVNIFGYYTRSVQKQSNTINGSSLSPDQLNALKFQIHAFKHLSSNQAVPEAIRRQLFEKDSTLQSIPDSGPQIPSRIVEASLGEFPKLSQMNEPESGISNTPKVASATPAAMNLQRILIPSATPAGIDPYLLIQNREKMLQSRVNYRIKELEELNFNLSNQGIDSDSQDYNLKLKALIELKSLKLIDRQKKLREDLLVGMSKATTLATAIDRSSYRRVKKQTLREARQTEKIEKNQRQEKEKKEKQKHIDYLNSIIHHGRDMLTFHRNSQLKFQRHGQNVVKFLVNAEKEEQKRLQRVSQERLRALRADDEEAYMKLIDEAKDTRITQILQQTNSYLSNLTNAVLSQKQSVATSDVIEVPIGEQSEESSSNDYYNTAHRINEIITEQPKLMSGGTLKDYQIKGLQWMVSLYNNRLNGILADEMGLGKTIQTISLVTYLIERKKQNGPFLIIVPLSTISNWALEFEKWAPTVVKVVFKGSPNERKLATNSIRQGNFNVLLTTYEYIIKERPILAKIKWVHMIIDEGHRMKNANSKLSITLMQYYHSRYRLILTGTPLQNNLPELWALLNFVLPKIFNSVKSFDEWFNSPFTSTVAGQDKIELNEEESLLIIRRLHKVLRPFLLRRLKKDVESELPDKVETVIKCKMSALQSRLYTQIRTRRSVLSDDGKGKGIRALNNMVMQFRKICNHPYVFEEVENAMNPRSISDCNIWRVAGKFEFLDRVFPKLLQTDHRILMFFQMTQIMDIMEDYLRYRDYKFLRLDGSTKTEDRTEMLKLFNAPNSPYFIFLLSTRAGGLGLNLQTADTVIIFDLQAQDRAHRIGQTKEVRIIRLITSNSVEETILARAQYKLDIDGKVIQAGKFDNKTSEAEREALLRSLLGSGEADDKDEDECSDIDDDEMNEILARSPEELEIFKRMDVEAQEQFEEEWHASYPHKSIPQRLVTDSEIPSVYLQDPNEFLDVSKKEIVQYGRGGRNKKDIIYDDGLTEEQFMDAVEEGTLPQSVVPAREKEIPGKRERILESESEDDIDGKYEYPAEYDQQPKRKRGRPTREESREPDDPIKRIFGIDRSAPDTIDPSKRQTMTRVFQLCCQKIEQMQVISGGFTRQKCALFLSLPNRTHYPDYYQLITKPIAMDIIKARMDSTYYKTLDEFRHDFNLMFENACIYNVEGSEVYNDAREMQRVFNSELNELAGPL